MCQCKGNGLAHGQCLQVRRGGPSVQMPIDGSRKAISDSGAENLLGCGMPPFLGQCEVCREGMCKDCGVHVVSDLCMQIEIYAWVEPYEVSGRPSSSI